MSGGTGGPHQSGNHSNPGPHGSSGSSGPSSSSGRPDTHSSSTSDTPDTISKETPDTASTDTTGQDIVRPLVDPRPTPTVTVIATAVPVPSVPIPTVPPNTPLSTPDSPKPCGLGLALHLSLCLGVGVGAGLDVLTQGCRKVACVPSNGTTLVAVPEQVPVVTAPASCAVVTRGCVGSLGDVLGVTLVGALGVGVRTGCTASSALAALAAADRRAACSPPLVLLPLLWPRTVNGNQTGSALGQ
ncbi:hypothetical protein [Microbispora sp. NPDC049125]|uniref:hypothetical protein n=1 Tax=Microbispora sp. NPDC049125 TaxID=3154929 RepID=UPI003466949B